MSKTYRVYLPRDYQAFVLEFDLDGNLVGDKFARDMLNHYGEKDFIFSCKTKKELANILTKAYGLKLVKSKSYRPSVQFWEIA